MQPWRQWRKEGASGRMRDCCWQPCVFTCPNKKGLGKPTISCSPLNLTYFDASCQRILLSSATTHQHLPKFSEPQVAYVTGTTGLPCKSSSLGARCATVSRESKNLRRGTSRAGEIKHYSPAFKFSFLLTSATANNSYAGLWETHM